MTDVLSQRLREIVVRRKTRPRKTSPPSQSSITYKPDHCPLQEVVEAIELPAFDYNAVSHEAPGTVEIPTAVASQLREHIAAIAAKYNDNSFHSCKLRMHQSELNRGVSSVWGSFIFLCLSLLVEHACHVTMSVSKLLGRVQTPDMNIDELRGEDAHILAMSQIHCKCNILNQSAALLCIHFLTTQLPIPAYTHGICSDPLTIFAIVYSALIHDMDHQGISNIQLMKEDSVMATMYGEKSVAEQHSL
jgi:3'5'-cyclic nucleotide phosphodiesterase